MKIVHKREKVFNEKKVAFNIYKLGEKNFTRKVQG